MHTLDWTHAFPEGGALTQARFDRHRRRLIEEILPECRREAESGSIGFLNLLPPGEEIERLVAFSRDVEPRAHLILVGTGGSALAARLFAGLRAPGSQPTLHLADTPDPVAVEGLMRALDPQSVRLVGVSKSGRTVETTAVFAAFRYWLERSLGPAAREQMAVVLGEAGAEESPPWAGLPSAQRFPIPRDVGGRYSALSAAGLLPAALLGLEVSALLRGAESAREGLLDAGGAAVHLAALGHAAFEAGYRVQVLWTYGEHLEGFGPWWAQLLAESLGKIGPSGPTGPMPVPARGPAAQHSLLQRLVDGPPDAWSLFVFGPGGGGAGVPVPSAPVVAGGDGASAAPARTVPGAAPSLAEILRAQRLATAYALHLARRPVASLGLSGELLETVGAALLLFETATWLQGRLLAVDPFGQPAVETGKEAARALLAEGLDGALPEGLSAFLRGLPPRT